MLQDIGEGFRSAVRVPIYALLGVIMTFCVGLPLLLGGRFEGLIPLGLGVLALHGLRKELSALKRYFQ